MQLYFAFAANMDRAGMARRCPDARPLGVARMVGWQYFITSAGYGAPRPKPGAVLPGVLWQCSDADLAILDDYEDVESGLYRRQWVDVEYGGKTIKAIVYVSPDTGEGAPRPWYQELVVVAALHWGLPDAHIAELETWIDPDRTAADA